MNTSVISSSEIAFISGPIDTGEEENYFHLHYAPRIDQAVRRGDLFVIGPIPSGVDADALAYLIAWPVSPGRISIFVTPPEEGMWGTRFRASGVNLHVVEGQMPRQRDAELTKASTYDICRVRTKAEAQAFYGRIWRDGFVTNTERNWKRRRGITEDKVISAEEINHSMGFDVQPSSNDAKMGKGKGKGKGKGMAMGMGISGRWAEKTIQNQ